MAAMMPNEQALSNSHPHIKFFTARNYPVSEHVATTDRKRQKNIEPESLSEVIVSTTKGKLQHPQRASSQSKLTSKALSPLPKHDTAPLTSKTST